MKWSAQWITHPTAPLREPVTLHFRRTFVAPTAGKHFIVHVSADNRFILYLNGARVGGGPARGDLDHWRYETFDLGEQLRPGENILAATVWNFGIYAPMAQISDRTAFLVEGDTSAESVVNTDKRWMVEVEPGQVPYPREPHGFWQYMVVGAGERLDASAYDWNWLTEATTGGRWVAAGPAMRESIYPNAGTAAGRGSQSDNAWQLVPDTLPPMSYEAESTGRTVRTDLPEASSFPDAATTIPANRHVHILLDRGSLTTAYPRLTCSGGQGSRIEITYAEALYDAKQQKGDRDEVGTRQALGFRDLVEPGGASKLVFEPLWWRTWRYLDLDITTGDEPLRLESLQAFYTAYPLFAPSVEHGAFHSSDAELDAIWKIGVHTLELDTHETYSDAPYYEQLQYLGDARVEAMITYAVSPDDRLPRQAIEAFDESRRPDGLTASRYPAALAQYIPPFSLLWIGMVREYAEYHPDAGFIRERLGGERAVLAWFAPYVQANGLLATLPYWSFVDWTKEGETLPSYDAKGQSCLVTLEYVGALEQAAELERAFGDLTIAEGYEAQVIRTRHGLLASCWDAKAGLIADSPTKTVFSQQSNALAVLYDVVPRERQAGVMARAMAVPSADKPAPALKVIEASYYFDYYVARALDHAGLADRYGEILDRWRAMLKLHFSTWPEVPGQTRSDAHAWSAHPTYDLLTLVAGVKPASLGFERVLIEPHLGALTSLEATVPHPKGKISVAYRVIEGTMNATITLPAGVSGTFRWKGRSQLLHSGANTISFRRPASTAAR